MDPLRVKEKDAVRLIHGLEGHWLDVGLITLIVTSLSILALIVHL
jgi:hypothetical protein